MCDLSEPGGPCPVIIASEREKSAENSLLGK
jgi:hypothetical protein